MTQPPDHREGCDCTECSKYMLKWLAEQDEIDRRLLQSEPEPEPPEGWEP